MADKFKPVHMEFEGIQHIKNSDMIFPSTHWAIQSYFDVESQFVNFKSNE